ncbi:ETS homologous factor-like [Octopus bimaculoides]|uniref:ETS homologous factor-like n=1 Tax=Octopus bimaculoides TaxID=37653 RepID=UPI0022E82684|nr:ETS homologous factor-like [Octopus bimaculoides]
MTIRSHIPLVKPNSFEASCSSSDIYSDNDWSVKMANTDLYQLQQQPYLNYSNAQQAEIPDLISLPASLGSYDRCKATTEICHHNWWEINPDLWNLRELLDWMAYTLQLDKINSIIYLNNFFRDVKNGSQMRRMSLEEFLGRDPDHGSMLFQSLKYFSEYGNILFDDNNHFASPKEYYSVECIKDAHYNMEMNDDKLDNFYPLEFGRFPLQPQQQHHTALLNSSRGGLSVTHITQLYLYNQILHFLQMLLYQNSKHRYWVNLLSKTESMIASTRVNYRPTVTEMYRCTVTTNKKCSNRANRKESQGVRDSILSIRIQLASRKNNNFNPFIIRWEDEANGKFRFVHSEKFAKLWGEAKNNENMNYEKLSRAMRCLVLNSAVVSQYTTS